MTKLNILLNVFVKILLQMNNFMFNLNKSNLKLKNTF